MKSNIIDKMREKIMMVFDEKSSYTQEDFNEEFAQHTVNNNTEFKIKINFVNESNNPNPDYATKGSSGFDLRANLTSPITLAPRGGNAIIPTGLYFEIPDNFEIQIRSRSGLAAKNQVAVLNSPGTIDADYRGEIKIILINHGVNDFTINHGDRVAQAVIASVLSKNVISLNRVSEISDNTERSSGGFGSTGIN